MSHKIIISFVSVEVLYNLASKMLFFSLKNPILLIHCAELNFTSTLFIDYEGRGALQNIIYSLTHEGKSVFNICI